MALVNYISGVWRGSERLSGSINNVLIYLLAFPFKKLLESSIIFNCSMILIITLLLLLPAFRARKTGVSVFSLSFQSTSYNNLLSNHSFSVEHSAILRHTKCGGDELSSTESSTADLDAVESGTDSQNSNWQYVRFFDVMP